MVGYCGRRGQCEEKEQCHDTPPIGPIWSRPSLFSTWISSHLFSLLSATLFSEINDRDNKHRLQYFNRRKENTRGKEGKWNEMKCHNDRPNSEKKCAFLFPCHCLYICICICIAIAIVITVGLFYSTRLRLIVLRNVFPIATLATRGTTDTCWGFFMPQRVFHHQRLGKIFGASFRGFAIELVVMLKFFQPCCQFPISIVSRVSFLCRSLVCWLINSRWREK